MKIPWPFLGFLGLLWLKTQLLSDDSYMKALSYCKPLLWEAKKYPVREIYWEKNILRCTFTGKKTCLVHLGGKIFFAQSESSNPPPTVWIFQPPPPPSSKVKWSAPKGCFPVTRFSHVRRKSLNLLKFHISANNLNKYTLNPKTERCPFINLVIS